MTGIFKNKLRLVGIFSRILHGSRRHRIDGDRLSFEQLFIKNPQPMFIYDAGTLKFLEVNDAAVAMYGYTREEFLSMNATDIRPNDEVEKFLKFARPGAPFFAFDGLWTHKFKSGGTAQMEIFSNLVNFGGKPAVVVTAHDISEQESSRKTINIQANALEAAANGIIITDITGAIIWANGAFSRMTGYDPEEVKGKNPRELVKSGKHDASFYAEMWATILSGKVWEGELINRKKDGTLYHEQMTITPILDDARNITRFVAIKQDISEKKELEEAVAGGEKRLKELMDFLPQTVYEMDRNGNLTFSNRKGLEMFQLSEEEIEKGTNSLQYIAPEDRERAKKDIEKALETGKTVSGIEYKMVRKDGSTFPAMEYGRVIMRDGEAVGMRGLIVDITAQKEAEKAASSLRNRFEALFNNARDAMMLIKGNRVIDCNSAALDLFGYAREEILTKTLEDISPEFQPDATPSKRKSDEKLGLALQGKPQFLDWQYFRKDRTLFDAEVSLNKVELNGQDVALAVVRDVTERKALEEQLHQAQRLESLGQLTSGIAHDFNNVLGGIIGFSELALRKINDKATIEAYLARVKTLAERGARITKQLVAFSRKQVLRPRDLDLNQVVEEFLQFLPGLIRENIAIQFDPDLTVKKVYADPSQLEQVLVNLALNASDAMPAGGKLTFATANMVVDGGAKEPGVEVPDGEYALLRVTDTGTGISKEVKDRIFEPFFSTKGVGKGTGLGLSVVHGIVEQHSGAVIVRSEPGRGTTFEVYLPAAVSKVEASTVGSVAPAVGRGGTERILIVEDNPALCEMLSAALEDGGYSVVHARDGLEGLELFRSDTGDFSLVISDVLMPKMSGKELREKVRELNPGMKFLFMSGYSSTDGTEDFMIEPGADFIQKPFTISEISAKVDEMLNRQ